mgnify:FL=1
MRAVFRLVAWLPGMYSVSKSSLVKEISSATEFYKLICSRLTNLLISLLFFRDPQARVPPLALL